MLFVVNMSVFVANLFGFLVLFCILAFVFFASIDLGIGALLPIIPKQKRKIAFSIAHLFWDVNETWLIMAAVFVILCFTHVYSIIISVFYVPVILLLACLVIRGCALEFASKKPEDEHKWYVALSVVSCLITVIFGVLLGNFVCGINIDENGKYLGNLLHLFNVPSLVAGVVCLFGFFMLGAGWLLVRTNDKDIIDTARMVVKRMAKLVAFGGVILLGILFNNDDFSDHITGNDIRLIAFITCVVMSFVSILFIEHKYDKNNNSKVFAWVLVFVTFASLSFLSITYPYIVPYKLTIYDVLRFNVDTYKFSTITTFIVILLVVVIGYFAKNYLTFKNKVDQEVEY